MCEKMRGGFDRARVQYIRVEHRIYTVNDMSSNADDCALSRCKTEEERQEVRKAMDEWSRERPPRKHAGSRQQKPHSRSENLGAFVEQCRLREIIVADATARIRGDEKALEARLAADMDRKTETWVNLRKALADLAEANGIDLPDSVAYDFIARHTIVDVI